MRLILALLVLRLLTVAWLPFSPAATGMQAPLWGLNNLKRNYNADLFYYIHGLEFMNLGDLEGQKTPLSQYTPKSIHAWSTIISDLEDSTKKNRVFLPFLMTFYYAHAPQLTPVCVHYLKTFAAKDPKKNWRWAAHALMLSKNKITQEKLSKTLSKWGEFYNLPLFAKDADIRFMAKNKKSTSARSLAKTLLDSDENLTPEERQFLRFLVR